MIACGLVLYHLQESSSYYLSRLFYEYVDGRMHLSRVKMGHDMTVHRWVDVFIPHENGHYMTVDRWVDALSLMKSGTT